MNELLKHKRMDDLICLAANLFATRFQIPSVKGIHNPIEDAFGHL
jgi:hypothetical protein